MKRLLYSVFAAGLMVTGIARGQSFTDSTASDEKFSLEDNFLSGRLETALTSGPMFSPVGSPKNRPTINYAVGTLQLGYMVTEPRGDGGFFRGNFELAPEGFGAGIFQGPGNYIAGGTLWFRYNFVQPHWRFVPYIQGGGGFTLTDTARNIVGENFNFNLDACIGTRYFIKPRCTVNLEYRFQHISNADLGPRNVGINAQGPMLGVSLFF